MNTTKTALHNEVANAWKSLGEDLSTTEERVYGSPNLAAKTGSNLPTAGRYMRFFRGLGILTYRSEYGVGSKGGQIVYCKLAVPVDDGLTAIYKHFDAGRSFSWFESGQPGGKEKVGTKPHPSTTKASGTVVVAAETSPEVVRAVAGPEPETPMKAALQPLRKDEMEALIEAARQYAHRTDAVTKHINDLRELGVEVDMDMVMSGIKLTTDPQMEAIGQVLPYIDRLERVNERLAATSGESKGEMTELRRENGVLSKEVNDLRAANRRLSERNVSLAGQVAQKNEQQVATA